MIPITGHYLSFRVGHEWYGLDVDNIIEVLHFVELTELPGVTPDVLGLLTLRDTVMPVIDLRIRLGYPDTTLRLDSPIVAVHTVNGPLGLVVDDVDDVETVSEITGYEGGESPYVAGVGRIGERLVLLLETSRLREGVKVGSSTP